MKKRALGVLYLVIAGLLIGYMLSYAFGIGAALVIVAWVAGIITIVFLIGIGLLLISEES